LAENSAECSTVEFLVIWNNNLGERFLTPKNNVASVLTLELKSVFKKCGDALTP
jgi:hypothetical protein